MNARFALLALAIIATFFGSRSVSAEIRIVSGVRIDIDGTNANHWKSLVVIRLVPGAHAFPQVTVSIQGQSKTIYLKNLPTVTSKALTDVEKQEQVVTSLSVQVKTESQRVRQLQARTPDTAPSDSPGGVAIRTANIAAADLTDLKERLKDAESRLEVLKRSLAEVSRERAYFTGQNYGGLEVWDCGQKVPSVR